FLDQHDGEPVAAEHLGGDSATGTAAHDCHVALEAFGRQRSIGAVDHLPPACEPGDDRVGKTAHGPISMVQRFSGPGSPIDSQVDSSAYHAASVRSCSAW